MKKVIFILSLVLILVAVPVSVFVAMRSQELRKRAAPATTLTLSPSSISKKAGEVFSLDVRIDTGSNQVIAAEIFLAFDSEKLSAESITNGPLFPNILTSGKVDKGTASITVGASSNASPVQGSGVVATVRFKALSATTAPVSVRFDQQNTFVTALGEQGKNVLVSANPAIVTITGTSDLASGGATATPSASPTATPTATLTPSLIPTPTSTTSGEATASALAITSPIKDTSVADSRPVIQGKATPGAKITITIYSTPQTAVVAADSSGNWSYTPTTPLADGPHNIVVSSQDPGGGTQTATTTIVVAAGGSSATQSATPIAGSIETTILLLGLGLIFLVSGLLLPRLWLYF